MRIAMFSDCYFPRVNGVVVSVYSYTQELIKRGHNVCIISVEYPEEYLFGNGIDAAGGIINNPNFKMIRVPSQSVIFSKEDRLARVEQWFFVKKKMDEYKPDIIHINSEFIVGYFGAMYARHRRIPSIFTFHTMWEDYIYNYAPLLTKNFSHKLGRDLVKFYLKSADHILVPTPRIAATVKEYGVDTEVDLLPTGIPEDLFIHTDKQTEAINDAVYLEFPETYGKRKLLFAGRVAKEKNLDFLLFVLTRINELMAGKEEVILLLAGDGLYMNEFKSKAEKMGLSDKIFYVGYIERPQLAVLYKAAEIFVFPSKTETQGLVTAEAMFAGIPVVAIGEMGTVDVMQGDNGGYMVPEDVEIFSKRVYELLTNKKLYEEKSKEAKEWSMQWTISSLTKKLEASYAKCIEIFKNKHKQME